VLLGASCGMKLASVRASAGGVGDDPRGPPWPECGEQSLSRCVAVSDKNERGEEHVSLPADLSISRVPSLSGRRSAEKARRTRTPRLLENVVNSRSWLSIEFSTSFIDGLGNPQ
jgi:hypothetical protein